MHPSLSKHIVYPLLQWKSGSRVQSLLAELERSQRYHPEHLRDLQWVKVRALLHHAYRHVPYYRQVFDSAGLHPRALRGPDDLAWLPILTKEIIRDRQADLMAANVKGPLIVRRTSGSTGIPLIVQVPPFTRDAWLAAHRRTLRWWGLDVGMRQIRLVNPHGKSRATLWKQSLFMNTREFSVFGLDPNTLDRLVRQLIRSRCEVLSGYPSALTHVAQYVAAHPRTGTVRLRAVLTTGELLYPDQRNLLRTAFGCPVINSYGASECDHLAAECPSGSLHLSAENVLIEFNRRTSTNGQAPAWELLITDLTNVAMPLVRYQIGDLGAPGTACACGRTLPVLRLLAGRTEDLVTLPDGRKVDGAVFGVAVERLMGQGLAVKQFRAIQHSPELIEFQLVTSDPSHEAIGRIGETLQEMLGARLTILVQTVDQIPREPTGKLRRFVSRMGVPS